MTVLHDWPATPPVLRVPPYARGLRGLLGVHPLLVAGAGAFLLVPRVASAYWTFNVMVGLVLAIACLGLVPVVGWARDISLMQAGLTGAAVYICGFLQRDWNDGGGGYPFPLAAAFAVGTVVALSVLVALVSARLAGAYVAVLTLALQFLLENTVMISEELTSWESSVERPDFFGIGMRSDAHFYYYVLGAAAVSVAALHRLRHSRFGRATILAGSDSGAAAVSGISPWRYRVFAFCVAGFFAGVAGALSAPLYFSPPGTMQYISFNSLFYLSIPLLAGFDSLSSVVAVAVVFTLVPQVVLEWKLNVYLVGGFGLLVGVLMGPRGLGGALTDVLAPRRRQPPGGRTRTPSWSRTCGPSSR